MHDTGPSPDKEGAIAAEAGAWVARRDRGLSAVEQDAFLQWLRDDRRHREALAKLDLTWSALDSLTEWQPKHSAHPNPDLLAPRRRHFLRIGISAAGLAAALVIVAWGVIALRPTSPPQEALTRTVHGLRVIPGPERQVLPDGSVAECRHGSQIEIAFTESERRLRLLSGELHVSVTKNPLRPFVVEADGVTVRALGTAFVVRRGTDAIDVLVTEGRVRLDNRQAVRQRAEPVAVSAGERARIDMASPDLPPVISPVSAAEIENELAWQSVRLEFEALPLATLVAEFNLRNQQQLLIGDPEAGRVNVAGTFRADQVDAFVRLLEASFGIRAERRLDGPWVLRKNESLR
ncbi:MAG: FecR domain-containing protein [Opitutaceae bacterium]|nr:FecR domain-containing protein [Opitutaceae bacterium]